MNKIINTAFTQFKKYYYVLLLLGIIYFAAWLRWATANFDILLDYDPWWFYRYANTIYQNNFVPPRWDLLSFYPPGRPVDFYLGWSYTIAIFYAIWTKLVSGLTMMKFSGYFVAIFAAICAVPAYFVGKTVTNKWGGLATALFAVATPAFLAVSMAGYPDSDSVDVFYTFLVVYATLYAIQKRTKLSIAFAVLSNWLFALNWTNSSYIYFIFLGFIPILLLFQILGAWFSGRGRGFKGTIVDKIKENKSLIIVILEIGVLLEIVSLATQFWPFNVWPLEKQLLGGMNILSGQYLLVNQSVAELQALNVFSLKGLLSIIARIGGVPFVLATVGMLLVAYYKRKKKLPISIAEYFTIIWMIISFILITRGIRFSLLFSIAIATAAGFVIGNLIDFMKKKEYNFTLGFVFTMLLLTVLIGAYNSKLIDLFGMIAGLIFILLLSFVFWKPSQELKIPIAIGYGILLIALLWHVSENVTFSRGLSGLEVDQNWKDALTWLKTNADKDSLVATWWDPGHIITGFTGLKVHADGAHCIPESCIPYNHNDRIQDMGTMLSTKNENQTIELLKKYKELTPGQCAEARQTFGNVMPADACKPVTDIYLIVSNDLIGKYYWLNYFGQNRTQESFLQLYYCGSPSQTELAYCIYDESGKPIAQALTLTQQNNNIYPVLNLPSQGITSSIVKDLVVFKNNVPQMIEFTNVTKIVDGMVIVDPSLRAVLYMDANVRDSIFTRLYFFNGNGLTHFQSVFSNSELKIYKVIF